MTNAIPAAGNSSEMSPEDWMAMLDSDFPPAADENPQALAVLATAVLAAPTAVSAVLTMSERANAWIDAAYAALVRTNPDFVVRDSQCGLSKDAAAAFITGTPLAAEAPTGTGKTIAYLLGALAASEVMGHNPVQPIVISTATKALQSQLFEKDLPSLVKAGLINSDEAALAKGKGNYLCLSQADEVLYLLDSDGQETFIDAPTSSIDFQTLSPMIDGARAETWDGDFDTWKGVRPISVRPIAVSTETCNSKKCANYKSCSYFRARARLGNARIIVANHDLVLRDLLLAADGESTALPVSNYYIVFDEGHHLPTKAVAVGARDSDLTNILRMMPKLAGIQRALKGSPELIRRLLPYGIDDSQFERKNLSGPIDDLVDVLGQIPVDSDSNQFLFPRGVLPPEVLTMLQMLQVSAQPVATAIAKLVSGMREIAPDLPKELEEKALDLSRRALDFHIPTKAMMECIDMMLAPGHRVKWVFRKDDVTSIHCSPLEGADVLVPILWNSKRAKGVVICSATLRDIDGFKRFIARSGMPATAKTTVLEYTFPYHESKLVIAGMKATPKMAERKEYLAELSVKMLADINPSEGTLILFPSRVMLKEFVPKLRRQFGDDAVLVQGEHTVTVLREMHAARIAAGKGSVMVGLATLAEGLDLPGELCTHVVITALPFSVPNDPIEQELANLLGKDYFAKRSLPDAMTRLVQMIGRLLRRETDRGRVTIYDRRMASTSYGRRMLDQLPPFTKIVEPIVAK